jgi:hypothetical protein
MILLHYNNKKYSCKNKKKEIVSYITPFHQIQIGLAWVEDPTI